MSVKSDIMRACRGELPERVPWTIYSNLLPQGEGEKALRSHGLGLVHPIQIHPVQSFNHPSVEVVQRNVVVDGKMARRITYRTPVGELTEVKRSDYASGMAGYVADWRLEYMVKRPEDYEVLEFIVRDQVFGVDHDAIRQVQQELGDDGVAIVRVNRAPFQRIWIEYTGIERLCMDLVDHRELVERVMRTMIENDREVWRAIADSPIELVQCGDAITADIVSPRLFRDYFLPFYRELCKVIRPVEKPVFVHIDGFMRSLAGVLDEMPKGMIIEAFTPPPTGDLSLAEARSAWPGRPIWINFPSSVHLSSPNEVEATTLDILRQAAPGDGFLFGITENMPATRWQESMAVIGRVLDRFGRCPIAL